MKKINQKGFGALSILLALLLIGAVSGAGYYVYSAQKDKKTANDSSKQITSFDECVAAGNPVMESFPEQCAANGQTFSKGSVPNLSPVVIKEPTEAEIASWKTFTAQNGKFSISVPDGWTDFDTCGKRNNIGFTIRSAGSLSYIPGQPARTDFIREECSFNAGFGFHIYQADKECTWNSKKQASIIIPGGYADISDLPSDFNPPEEVGITEYTLIGHNGVMVCMYYLQQKEFPDVRPLLLPIAESFRAY